MQKEQYSHFIKGVGIFFLFFLLSPKKLKTDGNLLIVWELI